MNVHKYLLAVVLGLGICTGNADCSGIKLNFNASAYTKKQPNVTETKEEEKVSEVTCAQVIRDYISNIVTPSTGYGNVLAVKGRIQKEDSEEESDVIIVLKNGKLVDPSYVPSNNKVIYINVKSILNSLGVVTYVDYAMQTRKCESFKVGARNFKATIEKTTINNEIIDRLINISKVDQVLEIGQNKIPLEWWRSAKHTEVQLKVLDNVLKNDAGAISITVNDKEVTLKSIDCKEIYSIYEPCGACRQLDFLNDKSCEHFYYHAMDKSMQGNKFDCLFEIKPRGDWCGTNPQRSYSGWQKHNKKGRKYRKIPLTSTNDTWEDD